MNYTSNSSLFIDSLRCEVDIEFREVRGIEEAEAVSLIRESHYQQGEPRGRTIAAYFVDEKAAAKLRHDAVPSGINPRLAGAAVIDRGCVRGAQRAWRPG